METDTTVKKKWYVIHFGSDHLIMVDNYVIGKDGILRGYDQGGLVCVAKSFTYITAVHKGEVEVGMRSSDDVEQYLNEHAVPMEDHTVW